MLANLDKLNAVSQAEEIKTPVAPTTPGLSGLTGTDIAEPEDVQNEDDVPMNESERLENEGMYSALSDDGMEEGHNEVQEVVVYNQIDDAITPSSGEADVQQNAVQLAGSDIEVSAGTETIPQRAEEIRGDVVGNEDGESRHSAVDHVPHDNTFYTDPEHANQGDIQEAWEGGAPPGAGSSQRRSHHHQVDGGGRERGRRNVRQDRRVPPSQRAFDNMRYRANDDSGSEENNAQEREGGELYDGNEDFDVDYNGEEEYEFDSSDDDEDEEDEEDEDEEDDGEGDDDSDNEGGDAEDRGIDVPTDDDREVRLTSLQRITSYHTT